MPADEVRHVPPGRPRPTGLAGRSPGHQAAVDAAPADAQLVLDMRRRVECELRLPGAGLVVQARDGVISFWGLVRSHAEKFALEAIARETAGCAGVDSHLLVRSDITRRRGLWCPDPGPPPRGEEPCPPEKPRADL